MGWNGRICQLCCDHRNKSRGCWGWCTIVFPLLPIVIVSRLLRPTSSSSKPLLREVERKVTAPVWECCLQLGVRAFLSQKMPQFRTSTLLRNVFSFQWQQAKQNDFNSVTICTQLTLTPFWYGLLTSPSWRAQLRLPSRCHKTSIELERGSSHDYHYRH
jgi:hypothetical protein